MPPKRDANKDAANAAAALASASNPGIAALEKRVSALEHGRKKDELRILTAQKKDLLNAEVKSYSNNFFVKGMKYAIKDVQGDEEKEEKFREKALKIFVDQGLLPAKKLFVLGNGPDKGRILRGVLRHAHPVGTRDNSTVVVAFLESWFAGQVNHKFNSGKKLKDGIRISQHMPPIIDALRNEALKARKDIIAEETGRRIIMKKSLRQPWIQLVELKDGRKTPIDFPVDDDRLNNPALTLAKLEMAGFDGFTPKAALPLAQRAMAKPGIVKGKLEKAKRRDEDDEDDNDADEDVEDAMLWSTHD